MDKVKLFRESTRELERNLEKLNSSDCCQCNVNTSQCFLVVEIGRKPGICVKELAELLKMDKSAVSRSVEELVQKGYVLRESSKRDRRCVVLNLTDEGMARFNAIEKDMNLKFERVFSMIPKEKQSQVLEALNIYNDAIKKSEVECCD
ncbi:MarR family winged helix-turn-helix transcriptional regulator [Butyrivibrio sp. INlla14]|uniref:MarR family winged helix-turn-helix transcriptional regulator n=1 Tax=Butyrivibrio sp. INlla14 TaxID=1520808 RepID=UPI0008760C0A|nr:MarR family transcriptional regulator [Butyrivibrio sp. INlla14]SCY49721.1 DNA-binding transcriptional regulator, MarR family [Butyrivibrio sp. INlla14]